MSNCLIVGPAWVGDMVMAQVLFMLLKQQQPDRNIDVIAPEWAKSLLARMPEVRHALVAPFVHNELGLKKRYDLGRSLRGKYDESILCPNSFKSGLVPFWANISKRTGWRGEWRYGLLNDCRILDKQKYPLMIERFAALAFPEGAKLPKVLPFPKLVVDKTLVQQAVLKFQIDQTKPIIILCPGAEFGPSKRWPETHYQEVATAYLNAGWQVWVFGAQKDIPVGDKIVQLTLQDISCSSEASSLSSGLSGSIDSVSKKSIINFCGKTSLAEAIDLMSLAQKVVTNDSGLMHIAAALDIPLVAVYGSSSPSFTPPLSQNAKTLMTDVPCRPCFKRTCPLEHHACMQNLKPAQVLEVLQAPELGNEFK